MIPDNEMRLLRKLRHPSLGLGLRMGLSGGARTKIGLPLTNGELPTGMTLTRASTGTYYGDDDLIASAAIDEARFDYLLNAQGALLIEPQRTNIILRSADFSNASWTKSNGAITTNAGTNPDGSSTIQTFTASATNGFLFQASDIGTGNSGVNSVWIKRRTGSGAVSLRSQATGTQTNITVTNDWARVTMPVTGNTGGNCWVMRVDTSGDAVDLWGAQLEVAATATSYIPTVASQVTRSADVAKLHVPVWIDELRFTFDDDSTQDVAVTPGEYTIPTNLNRPRIKGIFST